MDTIVTNITRMWRDIRANWQNALATHLLGSLIVYVLLAPLATMLLNVAVSRSGATALSDQEILFFILTPFGLGSLLVLGAIGLTVLTFKHAALMSVLHAAAHGKRVHYTEALLFVSRRSKQVFMLGIFIIARILAYVLPLLAVSWLVVKFTLSEYDINYYLGATPAEFWVAATLIGAMAAVTAIFVVRMLLGWVYSLPLILFENQNTREAMANSRHAASGRQRSVLGWLGAWFILDSVLLALALGLMTAAGSLLVPMFIDSIRLLVLALGAVLLLGGLLSLAGTFLSAAFFSTVLLYLYRSAGLETDKQSRSLVAEPGNKLWMRRRWLLAGGIAALVVATVFGKLLIENLTVVDRAQIIAHRGASAAAPENTLAAIELALDQGTDWVEIDVQETSDGEVVVIHDRDVKKISGADLEVYRSSLEQLQAVDIGSWFETTFSDQRISTLEQVLLLCEGRAGVLIELKYYGHEEQLEQRVADIVAATGMEDQVMAMSLSYEGISRMREVRPQWKLGLLSSVTAGDLQGLDIDFYALNGGFVTRAFVGQAHDAGREVMVWTVNDPVGMSQLMSRGVDGIITDEPGLARSVLEQRAALDSGQRLLVELASLFGDKSLYLEQ